MTGRRANVRVYTALRTVHLERLADMQPAEMLYTRTRYDFDESVLSGPTRPQRLSRPGVVRHLLGHGHDVVEVVEPFMVSRWVDLVAQVVAVRIRAVIDRRPTAIVTYMLSLTSPVDEVTRRWHLPHPVAERLSRVVLRWLVQRIDRIAFGTEAAHQLMRQHVDPELVDARGRVFPAVPARCSCVTDADLRPDRKSTVLFVGAFVDRKGIRQLMAAWSVLGDRCAEPTLTLIGTGPLESEVRAWADGRDEVTVIIDPPRATIHEAMRSARVVVLLSQRRGIWREQVGLPIVEGLSHGCRIVTSDETGLASWLADHQHTVVAADATSAVIAASIERALAHGPQPATVVDELPDIDMRIRADQWMFAVADDHAGVVRPIGGALDESQ